MKTIIKKSSQIIGFGALLLLTSCDGFGPFHITMKGNSSATLLSKKGAQFEIQAGQILQGVRIEGKSKKVVLSLGAQKVTFEGADYVDGATSVNCHPETSKVTTATGEAVGLEVARSLLNSEKEVFQENRQCQVTEQRCYPVCHGPYGNNCHTECVIYTRPGRELVEREELRLTYGYTGQIVAQNQALASMEGRDQEVHVRERIIFPCR